jgi:hypothetical protein
MENADNLDKSVLLKKRGWDKDGGGGLHSLSIH